MTKDIGYIAQRSSNPNLVKSFLEALPPGTLENGVDKIPDEDVRKRFKLRSPSMTKALIKLGVNPDVVAGYYAAFTSNAGKGDAKVYHMTTFPCPDIMKQQSDTNHYTSCMRSPDALHGNGKAGEYYSNYIDDEIEAYSKGDLGMLVVGSHQRSVTDLNGIEHPGNNVGFIVRAKIRVLYFPTGLGMLCGQKAAIMVDRIYGNASVLYSLGLPQLVAWNNENYGLPILIANPSNIDLNTSRDASKQSLRGVFGSDMLLYPHSGYHDVLEWHTLFGQSSRVCKLQLGTSDDGLYDDDYVLFSDVLKNFSTGLQFKAYSCARNRRRYKLINELPVSEAFIERASGRFIQRNEGSKPQNRWRFDVLGSRFAMSMSIQIGKYFAKVLAPALREELKNLPGVVGTTACYSTYERTCFDVLISEHLKVTVISIEDYYAPGFAFKIKQASAYSDNRFLPRFSEEIRINVEAPQSGSYILHTYGGYTSLKSFYEDCEWNLKLTELTTLKSLEPQINTMHAVIETTYKFLNNLKLPRVDNPNKIRYNSKRVKKLLTKD